MQIVKINEEYIELIKKTKDISNNISAIKKDLASVRLNLDKVYDGRVDFDTRLRNAEKKLTNQASKMKTLSDFIESTIDDIMQIDNVQPQINVESGNPAGVIQMPSLQEALKHWSNFKERYSTSRWKEIFDSTLPIVGGITGWTTIIPTAQNTAQKILDEISANIEDARNFNELEARVGTFADTKEYPHKAYYKYNNGKSSGVFKSTTTNEQGVTRDGNCTWYVLCRYNEMNERNLTFDTAAGNAKNWYKSIDKDKFNSLRISEAKTEIHANTIAVDTTGTFGHVCYIEGVATNPNDNKTYVYFSEGGANVNAKGNQGKLQKMDIDSFASKYEYILSAK